MARIKKVKKTQNEIWQEAKLDPVKLKHFKFNWAKNMIRRGSYRWPGRFNAKKRNYIIVPEILKNGDEVLVERCFCDVCGIINFKKYFQLDHLIPCVLLTGWDDFNGYIDRMMCLEEGFSIKCKDCHRDTTNKQLEKRVINRKKSLTSNNKDDNKLKRDK